MSEPPSDLGEFLKKLYPVVCDATDKYKKIRKKGAQFEDEVSGHIYDVARDLGYSPYKPRYTLNLPTRSNNKHQFDAAFTSKDTYYLVECKNTQSAGMDYIYYFNSKILDYAHMNPMYKFKGIFLCAASIPDSAWRYSISYGLRLLDPDSPPIEYMINTCSADPSLGKILENYLEKLEDASEYLWEEDMTLASSLYEEYRYYITRWRRQLVD